jgi:hypothetical protein
MPKLTLSTFFKTSSFCLVFAAMTSARAQTVGPITPPPTFKVKAIPATPNPGAPPMPADQIIQRFVKNEDLIKATYDSQSFDQSVKLEELVSNGGQFDFAGQEYTKPDGQRYQTVTKPPTSTLHYTEFSLEDVKTIDALPLFFLTSENLPLYNLTYEGQEKLDQINTFIFRVKAKNLGNKPLFDGVIWVDDQDFAIVKSDGQFLTITGNAYASFPFSMFETYSENLQGHLWFPTYIRSDGHVKTPNGDVPIRLIVRSENFKPSAPMATPNAASSSKPSS